jgi:hypothetical protein
MAFISFILMQLMAAYTVLVEPLLRTNFYRNLKKQLNLDPSARLLFYRTQVLWEWSWVVVLIVIVARGPFHLPAPAQPASHGCNAAQPGRELGSAALHGCRAQGFCDQRHHGRHL